MKLDDLIGKPYKEGARGPGAFDCWGLVLEVAARAGIELPEIAVPADNKQRGEIVDFQRKTNFERIESPQPCCLVLFRIIDDENRIRWHVGFVLAGCGRFIHTTGKMGVNISALDDPKWKLHIEGYYKYCRLPIDD